MKCKVCGINHNEDECPVCGFADLSLAGALTPAMELQNEKDAKELKEDNLKGIKVYIRAYHWEEENDTLVEKFHEDIPIAENIHLMEVEEVSWSDVMFAKQSAGEPLNLTVVVEENKKKEYSTNVIAPDTQDMWKVGFVLQPGFKGKIKLGANNSFVLSDEISLKGR